MAWLLGLVGMVVALVELAKWTGRRRGSIDLAQEVRSKIYMVVAESRRADVVG